MLNRLMLRLVTVRALRGATLAGSHVYDSRLATIDEVAANAPTPVISVYTDDGHFRGNGRSLFQLSGDHRHNVGFQRLIIEVAITQRMKIVGEDGQPILDSQGNPVEAVAPLETDDSIAFYLDLIERQISVALMRSSPWAELWKTVVLDIGDHESKWGEGNRDGQRLAGRQVSIHCRLPDEFAPGQTIVPIWQRFFDLAATDDSLAPILPQLRDALLGQSMTDWDQAQAQFGLTTQEARAIGFGPATVASAISGALTP